MPRAKTPKAGDSFRLTQDNLGDGPGAIYAGQQVTVREVVDADQPGAHDDSEDAVVIEWTEPGPVRGDDGRVKMGEVPRAVSIGVAQFHEMFEEAK